MGRFQNNYGRLHDIDLIIDTVDKRSTNDNQYTYELSSEVCGDDFSDSASMVKSHQTLRARVESQAIDDEDDFQAVCSAGGKIAARQKQIPRNPNAEKSFEFVYAKKLADEAIQKMIPPIQSSSANSDASPMVVRPIAAELSPKVAESEANSSIVSVVSISDQSDSLSELSAVLKNMTRFPAPTTADKKPKAEPPAKLSDLVPAGFSLNQLDLFGKKKVPPVNQKLQHKSGHASSSSSGGKDTNRRYQEKPLNYDTYSMSDDSNNTQAQQQNGNVRRNNNNRHNANDRIHNDDGGNRKYASNNNNQGAFGRNQQRSEAGRKNESNFKKSINEEQW